MASYDLIIYCNYRTVTLSVELTMSTENILDYISSYFHLNRNSFILQVYDEQIKCYVDFDHEYDRHLRENLPKIPKSKLNALVSFSTINDTEKRMNSSGKFG
ncbi:unnamed protein product [Adineta ricciae]|uniref:PB1 domain-containing protein n=1 Tax=Adineta ricciae TaxID=249248 RepID=A0A816GWU0_ADIRI|nr:unnamed protein product [Adineta ricciae]